MTLATAVSPPRTEDRRACTLPSEPRSVRTARMLVADAFRGWGLDGTDTEGTALLLVSELVTNAVVHTGDRSPVIRVIVDRPAPGQVCLGVVDRAPGLLPRPQALHDGQDDEADGQQESGRGLLLIGRYSDGRWGYELLGGKRHWGKLVWALLTTTGTDLKEGGV